MVYLNWKQKYDDQIQSLQLMSSDTLSLISFFEQEIISAKEYLLWAQHETLLPILRDDFFEHFSHQNAIDLVGKYADLKDYWSPVCVPIGEWDGHLIIAGCFFEPLETHHSIIPILTSFTHTRVVWDFLRLHLGSASYATETPQEVIDATQFTDDASLEDTKKFYLSDMNGEADALEDTKTGSSISLQTETAVLEEPLTIPSFETLPKLNIPVSHETIELADEPTAEPVVIAALTEENLNIPTSEPIGGLEGLDTETPAPPTLTFDFQHDALTPPPVPIDEITNVGYKFNSIESWNAVRSQWSEIQEEMATFFDRTILVSINSELENFTEVIWSTSVNPVELGLSLTLKEPSIFRVVFTTFKPYHGPIINNPVNQSFLTNWNEGEIPAHVTVAPVIVNQSLKGLLIGIGNISAYTNNALSLAEKMSEKIAEILKNSDPNQTSAA